MTPTGEVVYDRVVPDAGAALDAALERSLTGYCVLEPQDALLLDADGRGVLGLREGVPVAATHSGTGRTGPDAVADLAVSGPYRVALYDDPAGPTGGDPVDPGVPADVLADDATLAARTREAAPADGPEAEESPDAVAAFLDNEEKIAAIRERARAEAAERAAEWGFEAAVDEEGRADF